VTPARKKGAEMVDLNLVISEPVMPSATYAAQCFRAVIHDQGINYPFHASADWHGNPARKAGVEVVNEL